MLLDESPLIVHCSFKEWIGFIFHPHSLLNGGSSSSFATVLIFGYIMSGRLNMIKLWLGPPIEMSQTAN
jgi:hypothetical protein